MSGRKIKALAVLICCCILTSLPLVGETAGTSYVDLANYRTALRCYQQSMTYVERAEWNNALSQAELGLVYDDSISDLWFVVAYSASRLEKNPAEILPSLRNALERDKWVDYSKDGALLLYAELLCDTGEPQRALSVLEGGTIFPSSSREYIKTLCYYRLGTEDSYREARQLVSEASRLYPDDLRFPQAFFTYEIDEKLTYRPEAAELGRNFSTRFVEMGDYPAELYLAAAVFAEDAVRERILLAFDASGKRHPMYAALALEAGILSETQAYDYFCSFAAAGISLAELEHFSTLLTEDATKAALAAFLNGYQGLLSHDTTGDRVDDLFVQYSRGRPSKIQFDRNQDGVNDWIARCDFGVPTELVLEAAQTSLFYKTYPSIASMDIHAMHFKFVDSAVDWTPFALEVYEPLAAALSESRFYVPQVKEGTEGMLPTMRELAGAAYRVDYAVNERPDARVEISVLDGQVRSAQYFEGGTLYAQLACEEGIPRTRNVDVDGDGWFELTQHFGFSPENYLDYASPVETIELYDSLFGVVFFPHGIYVRQALLDRNLDMEYDFGQEYTLGRGSVSTWGNPLSDNWDVQYVVEGETGNSKALFRLPVADNLVTVYVEEQVPVRVTMADQQGLPHRDLNITAVDGVYWLGEAGSADLSALLKKKLDETGEQGRSLMVQDESPDAPRFSAVKISDFYFGVLVDE